MKNKYIELFDITIISILLFEVLIGRWLSLHTYIGYLLDLLIVAHICINFNKYNKSIVICFILLCLYFPISFIILGGSFRDTIANLRDIFPSISIICFVSYLAKNNRLEIEKFMKYLFIPMNIYMILNAIVVYYQAKGVLWLSGIIRAKNFSFTYPLDAISGLLGLYGQACLALFMSFLVIYNFKYGKILNKKNKIILILYNVLLIIYSLYISAIYDNKLYYISLVSYILVYFFVELFEEKNINKQLIKRFLSIVCLIIVVFIFAYLLVPSVNNTINNIFSIFIDGFDYKHVDGSSERLALVLYYLFELNPIFGYGIGNARWTLQYVLGFHHFGISELGTLLCVGGVLLFGLIIFIYFKAFESINSRKLLQIIFTLLTMVVMLLTQITYSISGTILFMLAIITIGFDLK